MNLEHKSLQLEIKEITEQGVFRGIASPFNNIDLGMDRVLPTIAKRNNNRKVPYLWQHNSDDPIGEVKLIATEKGIEIEGKLFLDKTKDGTIILPNAYKAFTLMQHKQLKNSIGFWVIESEYVQEKGETIRNLKDIDIIEVSAVTFPMNPDAKITDVKSNDINLNKKVEDMEKEIKHLHELLKPKQEEKDLKTQIEEVKSFLVNNIENREVIEAVEEILQDKQEKKKDDNIEQKELENLLKILKGEH